MFSLRQAKAYTIRLPDPLDEVFSGLDRARVFDGSADRVRLGNLADSCIGHGKLDFTKSGRGLRTVQWQVSIMPKPTRLMFAEMNREELRAIAPETLVVLPIGATEQHGPHLPTGTDWFTVDHLAIEAARRAAEEVSIIVAPALPFGSSDHHLIYGGTLSLSTQTYYLVLKELLQSLARDGFTRAFLVNGHGGNHELMQLAGRDVALNSALRVGAGSYWNIAWDALIADGAHKECRLPGHAGIFETSMMMALKGDLVPSARPRRDGTFETDARSFHAPYRHEKPGFWSSIDGYTDSPDRARAAFGERWREVIIEALAKTFVEFTK